MNRNIRHSTLLITVVLVLALSAIATVPVLADSGTTPPPTTGSATGGRTSHDGSSTSLSQVPSGTKVVIVDSNGDKLPLGSQAAADILNSGDPIWCPSTVTTPNNSGLSGCTLVASSLADLISGMGTTYNATHTNSTIWIENTTEPQLNAAIILDGSTQFSAWAPYTLTLKGGWVGCSSTCVNTISGVSTLQDSLEIEHWHNAVKISNLIVSGATTGTGLTVTTTGNITLTNVQSNGNSGGGADLDNHAGASTVTVAVTGTLTNPSQFNSNTGGDGLDVLSNGAVTLTDVSANGNIAGSGAYVDNTSGTGTVTVNNTGSQTFNSNFLNGLLVFSNGSITVSNLHADGNGTGYDGTTYPYDNSGGIYLENDFGTDTGSVAVNGTSNRFTNNYEDGLDVLSNGAITTDSLIANGNGLKGTIPTFVWVGAFLENAGNSSPKPITLNGLNLFNSNHDDGLDVYSYGAIKANDLNAAYNANGAGVVLDNCNRDVSGYYCYNGSAQTVTVTGINTFNQNDLDGLDVYSYGNITAADLNASGNDTDGSIDLNAGVWLENDFASYTTSKNSKGTVTLTGTNNFSDNVFDGLDVYSYGAIKASNIHAVNNQCDGAYLDNSNASTAQAITLTNYNTFNYDGCYGLEVYSNGAISLSTLSANDNGGAGAFIANADPGFSSGVTMAGNDSFSGNYYDGLDVFSYGTITVNTATLVAEANGITGSTSGMGVYLDNCVGTLPGASCTIGAAKNVTLNGTSIIDGNYGQYYDGTNTVDQAGLVIYSKGSIKVNNVTASYSESGAGALLDNSAGASSATVTLTGFGAFNDNDGDGLIVNSKGNVTLTKVMADGSIGDVNSGYNGEGLNVTATFGKLSLTCGEFVNNADYGIDLDTGGTATIKGAVLMDNGNDEVNQTGSGIVPPIVRTCTLP